jgi:hypothetical protein
VPVVTGIVDLAIEIVLELHEEAEPTTSRAAILVTSHGTSENELV